MSSESARRAFHAALRRMSGSPPDARYWVVVVNAGAEPAGLVALMFDAGGWAEVGVMLAPAAQGRGYAVQALAALVAHAFTCCGLERLRARHSPRHPVMPRVLHRLGFTRTGVRQRLVQWELERGNWVRAGADARFAMRPGKR